VVIPFPQAGHFDPVPARVLGGVEAIIRQLLKAIAVTAAAIARGPEADANADGEHPAGDGTGMVDFGGFNRLAHASAKLVGTLRIGIRHD
jgi:hypothetical protein